MKNYVVIGLGRFGSNVARQLCKLGCEVLAMDVNGDLVQHISGDVTHAVVGDGQDKEVLRALGVGDFDCAIVSIGGDLAASILVTMNLKELGLKQVICKAHDETHRRVLQKLGDPGAGKCHSPGTQFVESQCAGLYRTFPGIQHH